MKNTAFFYLFAVLSIAGITRSYSKPAPAPTDSLILSFTNSKIAPGGQPSGSLGFDGENFYGVCLKVPTTKPKSTGEVYRVSLAGIYSPLVAFTGSEHAIAYSGGNVNPGFPGTLSGSIFYGAAYSGGTNKTIFGGNGGIAYSVDPSSPTLNVLHQFPVDANDGWSPVGNPVVDSGVIYGATQFGGVDGNGALYAMGTNGSGYHLIHSFAADNSDPAQFPRGSMVLVGSELYGATNGGNFGTLYRLETNGTGYQSLHTFDAGTTGAGLLFGNGLVAVSSTVYGLTVAVVSKHVCYQIFALDTQTGDYSTLFTTNVRQGGKTGTSGSLVVSNGVIYGVVGGGGKFNKGLLFSINPDGSDFTELFSFGSTKTGIFPDGSLLVSSDGTTLYGTTIAGGKKDLGAIFKFVLP